MDWNLAIERNREALKRILAALVAMAAITGGAAFTSPLWGGRREASGGGRDATDTPTRQSDDCRPPHKGEVKPEFTLPRHLHRAILALLRPAESAARRLVIVMARGLVVTLAPPRPREAKPASIFLSKPGGTGILMPRGFQPPAISKAGAQAPPRTLTLPLFDPIRCPFRLRRPVAKGVPRISLPGVTAPFPVPPRRPPAPDDPLDATRLALRLQALGAALDDLPRQAERFARWKAGRRRDAAGAQDKNPDVAGARNKTRQAGRMRRIWPLRPGRPPGQRPARRRTHEVYEILHDLHGLAFDVLECPDTS